MKQLKERKADYFLQIKRNRQSENSILQFQRNNQAKIVFRIEDGVVQCMALNSLGLRTNGFGRSIREAFRNMKKMYKLKYKQ